MSNLLNWAEEKWSSDSAIERVLIGFPMKLFVELTVAIVAGLIISLFLSTATTTGFLKFPQVSGFSGLTATLTGGGLFVVIWCDIIRETE